MKYLICACALFLIAGIRVINKKYVYYSSLVDSLEQRIMELENSPPEITDWEVMKEALIFIESGGNDQAIGDSGNAVGCLQIWPIYVDEANRLSKYQRFSYEDRYSRSKSLEMFEFIQSVNNPTKDVIQAIRSHNPKAGSDYTLKVIRQMFVIKNQTP